MLGRAREDPGALIPYGVGTVEEPGRLMLLISLDGLELTLETNKVAVDANPEDLLCILVHLELSPHRL